MGSIEIALWQAVRQYPGGAEAVAAVYGWNAQTLRNALNPNCAHRVSVEHMEGIYLTTLDPQIVTAVAKELGCLLLPVSRVSGIASDSAVLDSALTMFDSTGSMIREVRDSLEDGVIDAEEWERLQAASMKVQQAMAEVLVRCEQLREEK